MSAFACSGLNLACTTPFDAKGKIDYPRFEALLERYLAAGVHGFVLSSGTGMHVYLSKEESRQLVAFGAKVINGRARVIVQTRSEEHTSELQSLMRISYAVFCLKNKKDKYTNITITHL